MRHLSVAGAVLLVYTACSSSAAVPVEESVPSTRGSASRDDVRDNGSQAPRPEPAGSSAPAAGQPLPGWQGTGQSLPDYGAPLGAPPLGQADAGGPGRVAANGAGAAAAGASGAGSSGGLGELFYKVQVLEQEVQDLRGLVEEQRHQLERLARDQQEQYLDLDRRMQALRNAGGGAERTPQRSGGGAAASTGDATGAAAANGGAANSTAANGGERDAYSAAFNLMKERQFDASAAAFNELVENYPNGTYTANAYYWLGELHLAQDQNESARQSFAQVINLYPEHQKVADALYKLGVVYHRLGDLERARQYLEQVRSEHPDTSAAGLAQTYLAELQ